MKRALRWIVAPIKWALILVIGIEVFSFTVVTATNYILYGHAREGSRAVYDPYTLFLQAHGQRQTTHNASDTTEEMQTIWMFGGSTMRGATPHDDRTIPSVVAKTLNAEAGEARYRVVNFGVNSFNALLQTKYLQKALIERHDRPDVVIFYDGANDAKYFLEHRTPDGHHGYRRVQALIESYYRSWFGVLKPVNAAIYSSFTRELYGRLRQAILPLDPDAPALAAMIAESERRYDFVHSLSDALGAEFLLVWQPMLWTETCTVAPDVAAAERNAAISAEQLQTMRDNFSLVTARLAAPLRDKPYFADFRAVLCGRSAPMYTADGVHLTDRGRETVGVAMARTILDKERLELGRSAQGL